MFTLVRDPTLALNPTRYPFRPQIPTPASRSIHCPRPRRSIDGPLLLPSAYCYNLMNQMIALATRSP
jgi:hypothetical protein